MIPVYGPQELCPQLREPSSSKGARAHNSSFLATEGPIQFSQFSCSVVSDSFQPHGLQHIRLPCPLPTPGVYSNSCPLSWWCYPAISSSVTSFSFCLQSFPASRSFPMSWLFTSDGQSIGVSAWASVLLMNIQGWFPLGLTGLITLLSKGLWKHQFFSGQPSFMV